MVSRSKLTQRQPPDFIRLSDGTLFKRETQPPAVTNNTVKRPLSSRRHHPPPVISSPSLRVLPSEKKRYITGPRLYHQRGAPYPMQTRVGAHQYETNVLPSIEMLPTAPVMRPDSMTSRQNFTDRPGRAPMGDDNPICISSRLSTRHFVPGSVQSRMLTPQYPWPVMSRNVTAAQPVGGHFSQAGYATRTTVDHNDRRYYEVLEAQPPVLRKPPTKPEAYGRGSVSLQTMPLREPTAPVGVDDAASYPDIVQSHHLRSHHPYDYANHDHIPPALV